METHAQEQVHWQAPRASVATPEGLQAGWHRRPHGELADPRDPGRLCADRHPGSPAELRWVVVPGAAYGIAVEAVLINGIVNTQKIQTLYSSTPHWSWWVGHGTFGATLGLLSSVLLEKRGASHLEAPLTVNHRCDAALH
jgi:hypothetical protein